MPIQVLMPALSPTMTEGTLARWLKKEGDSVRSGDLIAEIETDKATMEVEAVDEGVLGKILVPAGTAGVLVNAPIAMILEEGEDASMLATTSALNTLSPSADASKSAAKNSAPAQPQQTLSQRAEVTGAERAALSQSEKMDHSTSDRVFATPLARRLAAEKGVPLNSLKGSGPRGRVTKVDVLKHAGHSVSSLSMGAGAGTSASSAVSSSVSSSSVSTGVLSQSLEKLGQRFTACPNNNIKKVTARRLSESKQMIPHFYLSVDCKLDTLLNMRKKINAAGSHKVSVNDFVIKAVAMALKEVPAANAAWSDDAVLQFNDVDVSVAVATPNGLITPIIKKADTKGLSAISSEMKSLAEKARDGKLKPEEFMGGGFTISNLGMFGVKQFSAIINPPQSCILAVGAGEQVPVVDDGKIVIATVMNCTLSVDHRSVDGAVGAEFLTAFKKRIEDPALLLL